MEATEEDLRARHLGMTGEHSCLALCRAKNPREVQSPEPAHITFQVPPPAVGLPGTATTPKGRAET